MKFTKLFGALLAGSLMTTGMILPVSATTPAQPTIKVKNIEQLLQAVGSNRTIQLLPGIYHLSPSLKSTPYVTWKSPEESTLVLQNIKNLNIIGTGSQQTKLVGTRCKGDLLQFVASSAVRVQGIGFGRMSPGKSQELDCSTDLRGAEHERSSEVEPDIDKISNWQQAAKEIIHRNSRGIELPEYTEALYPKLLEQVRDQTQAIEHEQDALVERSHSIRPRLGLDYSLKGKQIVDANQKAAQPAAMVFDRSHNLLAVFDSQANIILAVEGRNNTRQSWHHPPEWLMRKSMVPQSNAPAPNGIYAFGQLIKDNPNASHNFGSYRIIIEGGVLTDREILFHSRDNSLKKEITWSHDLGDHSIRTLGCFLFQDPDLSQLAQLLLDANQPVALIVQGSYAKNMSSPEI